MDNSHRILLLITALQMTEKDNRFSVLGNLQAKHPGRHENSICLPFPSLLLQGC